ncbi:hypothetical protein D1006_40845 [Burkholderia stabilis]|uniref:Uncharacterized protein n=1 Tax=Burkholderia stabilis TaxID=95485 RepID=A0A4Q2A4S7_9BURK|nr:hypothetical protein [Burkholderia stabilis]RXV64153.1 hypothetical protein D1006_40845 [Burkholderia stabilis]
MDYVLANFFAVMAAVVYSVFTSFIASRSGRLIYRKIMWGYLFTLLIAALVITVMQLPFEWLAVGALLSCIFCVFAQLGIAVKLRHITMTDAPAQSHWDRSKLLTSPTDDIRNSANPIHYGDRDPLRNW